LRNLSEALLHHATSQPDAIAYRFFQGAALTPEVLSFAALREQASAFACLLQRQGLAGAPLLLVCKSQRNFVVAFYGCLLAGAIAVPTAPPRRKSLMGRLQILSQDAGVVAVIHDTDEMVDCGLRFEGEPVAEFDMRSVMQGHASAALAAEWSLPMLGDDTVAFLQYTSGSTGDPKGVVVTHGCLMQNCAVIQQALDFNPATSILTALPLFHDMGLVGGVLESMYVGCIGNCMPPAEFVQYPERWLQIISKFGITISGGPNFMYDLAARSVTDEQLGDCNLSTWQAAFCGAEPIRASTWRRFSERFSAAGFDADAFYPCYGMAESTLFISGKDLAAAPKTSRLLGTEVVSCGGTYLDTDVQIVDPDSRRRVADGSVGEIWVSGGSVAKGYWGRAELTERTFHARIDGGGEARYLRTGDLGYLHDGELYVTGRLKDLIIAYGRKYAPQDIEDVAENSHAALRRSCSAAVSVPSEAGERLVVVAEIERSWMRRQDEWPGVVSSMRRAVSDAHGVSVDEVVFIRPGTLPRTSSGKVRRSQCAADYLAGALERAAAGTWEAEPA